MKNYLSILVLGWIILFGNSCEKSKNIDVDAEIMKEMDSENIRSVVACVVKDKQIVWMGEYGYTSPGQSMPSNEQSLYTLMSISKLLLATTVMQLWEDSLIDLNADINQYLPFEVRNPNFPDHSITTSMLLNHSSGLAWPADEDQIPDFHHFYTHEEPPLIGDWLPEYILPGGTKYRTSVWKEFAPGEKWLYSNIGTSLLGLIVENISGKDYRDYCEENILEPLEMNNSGFRFHLLNEVLLVTPYYDNGHPMNYYTCRHYPAGFISTNIEDFSHFMIAFLNKGKYNGKAILHESTVEKMFEIQNPASGLSNQWWHRMGNIVGHEGGGTGFSTCAEWQFDNDKGIVIFSNKVNESVYPGGRIYELVRFQATKY